MKLEVGQKIGIYEALRPFIFVRKNKCYLGSPDNRTNIVRLFTFRGFGTNGSEPMFVSEVRLIASLRVKSVK